MTKPNANLQRRARRLAQKFWDDAQALFDHEDMDDATNESAVFQALMQAQVAAEDVTQEEVE